MKKNELNYQRIETIVSNLRKALLIVTPLALLLLSSCSSDNLATEEKKADGKKSATRVENGSDGGYIWQMYIDDSNGGWGTFYPYGKGDFGVRYGGMNDIVAGKGWYSTGPRNIGYWVSNLEGQYDTVGVYGFTQGSVEIEYYVNEFGYGNYSYDGNGWKVNDVWIDGHNYEFGKHLQINQPAPSGRRDFWQYIDNWGGAGLNQAGYVNLWAHIENWQNNGGEGWSNDLSSEFFAIEAFSGKSGGIDCGIWEQ